MNDDLVKFKALYFSTAKEHTESLKTALEKYAQGGGDALISEMYIAAHSLKSQSLMMGYEKVGKATRLLEKSLRSIKDGVTESASLNEDLFQRVVQKIDIWLKANEESEPDLDLEIAELDKDSA